MLKVPHIHGRPDVYYDLFKHFRTGTTIREFVNTIEQLSSALKFPNDDEMQKFKGDSLEVLSELFFSFNTTSPRHGIKDYEPVSISDDFGVDAIGYNANGHKVAVQCKYKANPQEPILYADVAKTFTSGLLDFECDVTENDTIFVFTTSNVMTSALSRLEKKLVFLSRNMIGAEIDNNKSFWELSYLKIHSTLNV